MTLPGNEGVIGRAEASAGNERPEQIAARPDAEIDASLHGLLQALLDQGGRTHVRHALEQGQVVGVWLRAFPRQ